MSIHLELSPDVEATLAAQAEARGITLEQHAGRLLKDAALHLYGTPSQPSANEISDFLDALASKHPKAPNLRSETFSREMIYDDHD